MAACSDLELEEKSSEERLPRPVRTEDAMSQSADLNSCNEVTSSYRSPENSPQPEQSEAGDLNKLSDDEFLHLLEEASTFNKPNNQESVLLKQLRKEVAETDPCDNVSRTKPSRVSDGSHGKRSKHPSGYCKNRESGLVRSGATDSDAVSLPQRTLDYSARRKNDKLGRSREYPNIRNNALTTSGLGKSGHQSQSLQDLVNSDLVKNTGHSYRKLQRAQRAASFSSAPEDQDSELEFESFRTSFKCSKRTKQQMHSSASCGAVSKSASNSPDKNKIPSSSKHDGEETKSRNRKLSASEMPDTQNLPALPLTNSGDHADCPVKAEKDNPLSPESPAESTEIEMKDISSISFQDASDENDSQNTKADQQSNSKFYVNCTDVDSTVTFPLKLVSTNGEINKSGLVNEAVNDKITCQQVNFPMTWKNSPVQQFLHSLPVDHEAYPKKDKQLYGPDVNGNPFSKTPRAPNITQLVSATLLDYPGSNSLVSENQAAKLDWCHRKTKRTRNSVESQNVVFSENIAGHRGKEDIDTLLKFINSSDKKSKNGKGVNSNQSIINKSTATHESEKKKMFGKGLKNCHNKNIINTAKKKLSSPSNSEEEYVPSHEQKTEVINTVYTTAKFASSESNVSYLKASETVDGRNLDVNSNITVDNLEEKSDEPAAFSSEPESAAIPSVAAREGISSFAADFYLSAEVPPHAIHEDTGFHEVKKKQRKKHMMKRTESYRWRSAAARAGQSPSDARDYYTREKSPNKGSIMLLPGMQLSQRNQCGKQDSRRKSTSSVPHSEQSSADNSDLDSVHSLPVKGSARHPTQPQPHTSPSSSSSTPQASYADIAKMPVSSKLSPPFCENLSARSPNKDSDLKNSDLSEISLMSELETTQSKTVQTQTLPLFAKNVTPGSAENEPSSISSVRTSNNTAKSTRENNTQTDPCPSQDDRSKDKNVVRSKQAKDVAHAQNSSRACSAKDRNVCTICHCTYKDCNCDCSPKSDENIPEHKTAKNKRPPVIMMDDSYLSSNVVCDISFGVDLNEVLTGSSGENFRHTFPTADSTSHCASLPSSVNMVLGEQSSKESISSEFPNSTSTSATTGSSGSDNQLRARALCDVEAERKVLHTVSSPRLKLSGQSYRFQEVAYDIEKKFYAELVNYISTDFERIKREKNFKVYEE